jgi:DNA mismatch repair ATPase MutS
LPTIFEISAKESSSQNARGRQEQQVVFRATALGHPLLPDLQKICNDFTLTELGEIALITGSNMAGKSTFLRTVGVNLALAYAGGPVDAGSLQTGLFRLFSCIKVSDSVTEGTSYFYAEVKRLKALLLALEEARALPLFFLIDEIFRGTNNRERMIGSQAYVHALVEKNGVGLISTHDLELTKLADQAARIKNYHFRDDIRNGEMVFDYILHPGPCPTTNALKIMQQAGLPV